jgi:hypothetical protein
MEWGTNNSLLENFRNSENVDNEIITVGVLIKGSTKRQKKKIHPTKII